MCSTTYFFTLHCRAKYHISRRRPGFEYPYWKLPEKLPEEADEEAVMLIGGTGLVDDEKVAMVTGVFFVQA